MRLAAGIAEAVRRIRGTGPDCFAVIDTEARRALHYADTFQFDHCDLKPPFRPSAYADAIAQADKVGYPAIVVDSWVAYSESRVVPWWYGEGDTPEDAVRQLDAHVFPAGIGEPGGPQMTAEEHAREWARSSWHA